MKKSELKTLVRELKVQLKFAYKEYKVQKGHHERAKKYTTRSNSPFSFSYNEIQMNFWKDHCRTLKKLIGELEEFLG